MLGAHHVWSAGPTLCNFGNCQPLWYGMVQSGCPVDWDDLWKQPAHNEESASGRGWRGDQTHQTSGTDWRCLVTYHAGICGSQTTVHKLILMLLIISALLLHGKKKIKLAFHCRFKPWGNQKPSKFYICGLRPSVDYSNESCWEVLLCSTQSVDYAVQGSANFWSLQMKP